MMKSCTTNCLAYPINKYVMELVGTFIFVLVILMAITSGTEYAAFAIGLALAVLVYAGAHVSGSHYNPAVTLAVALRGKISWIDALWYRGAQLLGAVLAAVVVGAMFGAIPVLAPVATERSSLTIWSALLVEVVFTFLLAFVVLQTATTLEQEGNSYFGFAIGLTVTIGALVGGAISGGAFNPAVGLGPIIAAGGAAHRWLYLVGPMVGGALAAGLFALIHDRNLENLEEEMLDYDYEEELVEFVVDEE